MQELTALFQPFSSCDEYISPHFFKVRREMEGGEGRERREEVLIVTRWRKYMLCMMIFYFDDFFLKPPIF